MGRQTLSESRVEQLLKEIGEDYIPQKGFLNGSTHYIVDFYLPRPRELCIEVDGGYHANPSQTEYDRQRDMFLSLIRGLKVVRITNYAVASMKAGDLLEIIEGSG